MFLASRKCHLLAVDMNDSQVQLSVVVMLRCEKRPVILNMKLH